MHAVQQPPPDPLLDRAAAEPERMKLLAGDQRVLAGREQADAPIHMHNGHLTGPALADGAECMACMQR